MAADGTGDNHNGVVSANAPTHGEVETICKKAFDDIIGSTTLYNHIEAEKWNRKIVEEITKKLVSLDLQYKYCVSCFIMETNANVGMNVASTCFWDKETDVSFSIRWDTKEVVAVCTIFAVNYV